MKLVLANNQSAKFRDFYKDLQAASAVPFDYTGYSALLFEFDPSAPKRVEIYCLGTGHKLSDYDGVYINGYLNTYELAAAVAIACQAQDIGFANREFSAPPSLSKLSMYAKLAAHGVSIPRSLGGSKKAFLEAKQQLEAFGFPAILKRADADRGIDNLKVNSLAEIAEILEPHPERSLWVLQEFIPNQGYYLLSFYGDEPAYCIYRRLEERPDGNQQKAHMYKPSGGTNASLIDLKGLPQPIIEACRAAARAMDRQIASVDCLYDETTKKVYVLEVNYNPQIVTITNFSQERKTALINFLETLGK